MSLSRNPRDECDREGSGPHSGSLLWAKGVQLRSSQRSFQISIRRVFYKYSRYAVSSTNCFCRLFFGSMSNAFRRGLSGLMTGRKFTIRQAMSCCRLHSRRCRYRSTWNLASPNQSALCRAARTSTSLEVPSLCSHAGWNDSHSAVYGGGTACSIGWIVLNVIFLYQLTNEAPFDVLRKSITGLTQDRRLQLLL